MARLAEFFPTPISTASGGDSPEKCRQRRRRRIELRRSRCSPRECTKANSHEGTPLSEFFPRGQKRHFAEDQDDDRTSAELEEPPPTVVAPVAKLPVLRSVRNRMPIFAAISTAGNVDELLSVKEDFCRPHIIGGHPLHLFAVFDGRGDPHVILINYILLFLNLFSYDFLFFIFNIFASNKLIVLYSINLFYTNKFQIWMM